MEELRKMEILVLPSTIIDINSIKNMLNLKELSKCHTRVKDISSLKKLERLRLNNTKVTDISVVADMTSMKDL